MTSGRSVALAGAKTALSLRVRRVPAAVSPLLLALVLLPAAAHAQRQVTIYRCTDASGALTVQNDIPCPKGSKQQQQVIDVPPPLPPYQPRIERMPKIVAEEKKQEAAEIAESLPPPVPTEERKAPPPLFECTTWEQNSFLTDVETPEVRCAPMQVVGLDGTPLAGAQACQNVPDQCQAVPEENLCQSWRRRVDEAKFRWKFANASDDYARQLEYSQLAATLRNSSCGQ